MCTINHKFLISTKAEQNTRALFTPFIPLVEGTNLVFINIYCLQTCWEKRNMVIKPDGFLFLVLATAVPLPYLCMWWQERMWPGCTVCWGSLRPHYASWTDVRASCMARSCTTTDTIMVCGYDKVSHMQLQPSNQQNRTHFLCMRDAHFR